MDIARPLDELTSKMQRVIHDSVID